MKLQSTLSLRVVALALPLAILSGVVMARLERQRVRERVAERVLARVEDLGPDRCFDGLTRPPPWMRGRMHGPHMALYDARFVPRSPGARPLPRELVEAARRGEDVAGTILHERGPQREAVLVRTPFADGPCAFVVLTRHVEPYERVEGALVPALLTATLFSLAVLIASGGIVRRIVRLAQHVRRGDLGATLDAGGDEIGDLARALSEREARIVRQVQDLSARERALREYIADTTHDVLVPLTVLAGELDAVARATDAGEVASRESVRVALEEAQYIGSLLHNLNARARLEGGLVTRVPSLALEAIVERVVARHRVVAARVGVSIDHAVPDASVLVEGDPTLLEQALSNLVHNAVRHNRPSGHVAVVLEARGGRFTLTVADDGPGVPTDVLPQLGVRGLRTNEARSRAPEGTGLGLHIVREVAVLHDFALVFEPNEPSGLVVRLTGPTAVP